MSRKFKGFFRPKLGDLQKKKKKGLRQNSEWFFGRNPKFKRFFRPKLGDLKKKKKKRSSPKFRAIFLPISHVQTFEGGSFRMGGVIFHFSQKISLKSTKNMRFCILHKPMGGARAPPPPPGYATVYMSAARPSGNVRVELDYGCDSGGWSRLLEESYLTCQSLSSLLLTTVCSLS